MDSQMRAADKGVNLMDIDTRLSCRVKQTVDGSLEPITFNDIFKALLPEGYEVTDIAKAIQSLVEDDQLELDGVKIKVSNRRPS
ncbi:MAG: hypothetical protein HPY61_14100 [Methanotrichaceae archaeon]|nr:hypothetical protein [Methanotrichaceae archaeon]